MFIANFVLRLRCWGEVIDVTPCGYFDRKEKLENYLFVFQVGPTTFSVTPKRYWA